MTLNSLIARAASAYPDAYVLEYWDMERSRPRRNPRGGDTLARFIALELGDTYDAEATDGEQIAAAVRAMLTARDELEAVMLALNDLAAEKAAA